MTHITFNRQNISKFVSNHEIDYLQPYIEVAHQQLMTKSGPGSEFTDWVDWPESYDKEEFDRILTAAERVREQSEVFIVIGIGGSYLGAKAAIDFLNGSFYNYHLGNKGNTQIFFAGNSISSSYLNELLEIIGDRDFSINMISKSGTTTEPAIAFRVFKEKLIQKYGKEEAARRIYVTTDRQKGAAKAEATTEGYETFVIPDGIGGRFTVLTAVGLLPIAVAGNDISQIMSGAHQAQKDLSSSKIQENIALEYVAARNSLYRKGISTEILVNYEPSLQYFSEWWKQLFGESEGKDNKGIFPSSANFSTDLHSIGQIIQDGQRNIMETVIKVERPKTDLELPVLSEDLDGLKYLEGRTVDFVNSQAFKGTTLAHVDGGVPNMVIQIPTMDEYSLGYLIYFFELAVAISGYINGVNPFDQPGVEAYKKNMFALLGKPGFEDLAKDLNQRI